MRDKLAPVNILFITNHNTNALPIIIFFQGSLSNQNRWRSSDDLGRNSSMGKYVANKYERQIRYLI